MSTSDPAPDEPDLEVWTYIGRRFNGPQICHTFLDPQGEERMFTGKVMRHPAIGSRYTIKVTHRDDGRVTAGVESAKFLAQHFGPDDIMRWRTESASVETSYQQELATKRLARDNGDLSEMTLGDLRRMLSRQPAPIKRGTLAAVTEWLLRTSEV